jgi:transposase
VGLIQLRFEVEANHEGVVLVDRLENDFIHFGENPIACLFLLSSYIRERDPYGEEIVGVRSTGLGLALTYLLRALGHDVLTRYSFQDV